MPYPSPSPSPSNSSSHHPPVSRPAHTDPETVSRPALFHLQADDDSDDEDEDEYADARSDSPANGARSGDDPLPKKRKVNSNASRYYALLELLQTEAHYLLDLRILVNVRIAFPGYICTSSEPASPCTEEMTRWCCAVRTAFGV